MSRGVPTWLFVNRLTKVTTSEHPYAAAMRPMVRAALRRHKVANKNKMATELLCRDWVQFCIPRGGSQAPTPQWHNLRTGERSDEFPRFPSDIPREAIYERNPGWRAQV